MSSALFRLSLTREKSHHLAVMALVKIDASIEPKTEWETQYIQKMKSSKRQQNFLAGRLAGKNAIQDLFHQPIAVDIQKGIFEQPILFSQTPYPIGVSISHSNTLAGAIAFEEGHPMGLDLHEIAPKNTKTILTQTTHFEQKVIEAYPSPDLMATFVWTAKEALSKILRCGLMTSFKLLELSKPREQENTFETEFTHFPQYQATSWVLANQHVATIVYPKKSILSVDANAIMASDLFEGS